MALTPLPVPATEKFERALAMHRSGAIHDAGVLYKELAAAYQQHFDFHYLCGVNLLQQAQFEEAEVYLQNAITIDPTSAAAHYNLAFALSELGRLQDGVRNLNQAIAIKPDYFEAHMLRAELFSRLRQFDDALRDCDAATLIRPTAAEVYLNRGAILKEMKRFEDAIESYDHAIALHPHYAAAFVNRANARVKIRHFTEALEDYQFALRLQPNLVEAHSNLAQIQLELGNKEAAIENCKAALMLRPDSQAWLIVGQIEADEGRFQHAEACYLKSHYLDPRSVNALCFLSEIKKFDRTDPLIDVMKNLLQDEAIAQEDRSKLFHAYGKIMNDIGQFDDAIESFKCGKALKTATFDIQKTIEKYDLFRSIFSSQLFEKKSDKGLFDDRPVFVLGMPRSGTTLIDQILASHKSIDSLGERTDLHSISEMLGGQPFDPARFRISIENLSESDIKKIGTEYLRCFDKFSDEKIRIIDKLPHNFEMIGLIHLIFPQSRIIHCHRNAMDNCISIFMHNFNESHTYHNDLFSLGRYYRQYENLMAYWRHTIPQKIFDVSYEETVSDLENTARSLVSFLGLEWDPNCLEFHQQERDVKTASRWQVRQPIYKNSIGRWRRYEKHIEPLHLGLEFDK